MMFLKYISFQEKYGIFQKCQFFVYFRTMFTDPVLYLGIGIQKCKINKEFQVQPAQ